MMHNNRIFIAINVFIALFFLTFLASQSLAAGLSPDSVSVKDESNNTIYSSRRTIITETVQKVSSCVVGINVTEIRQYTDPMIGPFLNDPFFKQFFGDRTYQQKVKSLGSGFIISKDGYIVTNDHVAGNAAEIVVSTTDGNQYKADIIGHDPLSDICLLKIKGDNFPAISLGNSDDVIIGEWVIALGNPFGLFEVNNRPTVTVGVVSATGMNLNQVQDRYYLNMIQTDAAINGGNSGGPLVNSIGEVIGMNTIIFTSGASEGSIGLGFAIPINKVKSVVNELKKNGKIERDFYTGLTVQNIDEMIARTLNRQSTKGVIVTKVVKNSPADEAGIRPGDVITQVDTYKIENEQGIMAIFQEYRTNQVVNLKIIREDKEMTASMKLEKR
jgi:serine protease Do